MFVYCLNKPVSYVDSLGMSPIDITIAFFNYWISGDGSDKFYDDGSDVAETFKNSPTTQAIIQKELLKYINGESYGNGNILYTPSEPDLWLSARNADYVIIINSERSRYGNSCGIFTKETKYSIDVTISDLYNFNSGHDSGDGIGSILNNMAYYAHMMGVGTDYNWKVHFYCTKTIGKTLKRKIPDLLK